MSFFVRTQFFKEPSFDPVTETCPHCKEQGIFIKVGFFVKQDPRQNCFKCGKEVAVSETGSTITPINNDG